jgi:hypothetical protein
MLNASLISFDEPAKKIAVVSYSIGNDLGRSHNPNNLVYLKVRE